MRIVFLHGLESGPSGAKARWLGAHFDVVTPDLDTRIAREWLLGRGQTIPGSPSPSLSAVRKRAFETPLKRAMDSLESHSPDVVIGSSFGGAVLLCLVGEGLWHGPCVFLASAGSKLTSYTLFEKDADGKNGKNVAEKRLLEKSRALFIHGVHDEVIPIEDSRKAVPQNTELRRLIEVDDGHRLRTILDDGTLRSGLQWVYPT